MRLSLPGFILILILALALQPSRAQTPATYRVAGTVVSAIDHHPLQRAAIQLLNPEDQRPIQSTTSDEYGRFAFTGVPRAMYSLQGTAPSYLATTYEEHDGFNTGIITGAGVDTESLILQLQPEAVIAGTIRDESTEPVQGATVHLFRQSHTFGDSRVEFAGNTSSDDFGRFEFAHLHPGTYFLAVTATPWYAVHPNLQANADSNAVDHFRGSPLRQRVTPTDSFVDSIDPSLDVAYAATFYPGTTDPASAAPIVIRGGDSKDVDLQLRPQPALTISLSSAAPKYYTPYSQPQLRISFLGQPLNVMSQTIQTPDHTLITGLAPGDYFLSDGRVSSSYIGNNDTPIHLADHSITAELPATSAPAHIHVTVESARDAKLPPHTQVVLLQSNREARASSELDEKNQATLDASPGDYSFAVLGVGYYLAVGQVIAGERPLPSNRIHLTSDQSAFFTLTVNSRTHTLQGVARKDGKPSPGTLILLVPTAEVHDIHDFYRQQSDLDGSWDIRGLAPGDYTLIAIDNGWDLDWHNDAVLSHYLPAATAVHIPDTADKVQTLTRPVPVQPR